MSMKRNLTNALVLFGLVAMVSYWIASEANYARMKRPDGVVTLADFKARFGEPVRVRIVHRDGRGFHELTGPMPSWPWLEAFPSSAPVYIFNDQGQLIEWFSDPGDQQEYGRRWGRDP